ncbi:MAG: SDR family oxidoreductase [Acidimicrobiales bacterium]
MSPPTRTVAVTGAASGIGAACAARLADGGHRVIGVDLAGSEVAADLGTAEGRRQAIEALGERAGEGLDGLVTCAGVAGAPSRPGALLVSVNYFGTVALLEGLRPLLARGHAPSAVAIGSNSATIQPGIPAPLVAALVAGDEPAARRLADESGSMLTYPATKLALALTVRRWATGEDWAGAGIRLNAVAPGMVETPLVAEGRADPEVAPFFEMLPIPIGRTGRPEEIAALVDLLLGPDGGYFCGSVLTVDGGSEALLRGADWPAPWDLGLDDQAPWRRPAPGPLPRRTRPEAPEGTEST